jgi:hypothetical protein
MTEDEKLRLKLVHILDQAAAQAEQHEALLARMAARIAAIPSPFELAARTLENPKDETDA